MKKLRRSICLFILFITFFGGLIAPRTVFRLICFLKLFVSKYKIEVFIQLLVLHSFDRAVPKFLKTVHLPGVPHRIAPVSFLLYLFYLFGKIKINGQCELCDLFGDLAPSLQFVLFLNRVLSTMIFLLYSQKYEPLTINLF